VWDNGVMSAAATDHVRCWSEQVRDEKQVAGVRRPFDASHGEGSFL